MAGARFGSVFLTCATLGFTAGTLFVISCSSDDDKPPTGSQFEGGVDGASSSGATSGFVPNDSEAPPTDAGRQPACVSQEAEATPGKRPVDIIFLIDNSESMSEEIGEVENQINENFAATIESSGTDYHLIMVSLHGPHAVGQVAQKICVKAPLSGTSCSPIPAKPAETSKFIQHNSTVESTNALCRLLTTLNTKDDDNNHLTGWSEFLRPQAFKVVTVLTDDRPNTTCLGKTFDDKVDDPVSAANMAALYDNTLIANAPQFGTVEKRNYVFHSIVGLAGYDPIDTSKPHPPEAPLVQAKCSPGSEQPGIGYQALSKLTGGLRFPTCGLNYTTMFQTMARGVIDKATLTCDYAFPANPPGAKIDPETAVVRYTSGAVQKDFPQAANLSACQSGQFYIEGDRIKLCPDTCNLVQGDPNAKVKVLFSCFPKDVQ